MTLTWVSKKQRKRPRGKKMLRVEQETIKTLFEASLIKFSIKRENFT